MYMGAMTDEAPMAIPAIKRKTTKDIQSQASEQPTAEAMKSTATPRKLSRRPNLSPNQPPDAAPTSVPHSATATVKPSVAGVR